MRCSLGKTRTNFYSCSTLVICLSFMFHSCFISTMETEPIELGAQPLPTFADDMAMEDVDSDSYGINGDENRNGFDEDIYYAHQEEQAKQDADHEADIDILNDSPPSTPPPPTAQRKFRLTAKTIFATWPHCTTPTKTILERIKQLPNYKWAIVSAEKHADGQSHRHAIFSLAKKVNIKAPTHYDYLANCHGNYVAAKSNSKVAQYIIKDGDYVSDSINVKALTCDKSGSSSSSTDVANAIMSGLTPQQIMVAYPGFYLLHSKNVQEFHHEWMQQKLELQLQPWTPLQLPPQASLSLTQLASWVNTNAMKTSLKDRPLGTRQLFLWGTTALGKTSLVTHLSTMMKTFFCTSMEHFFNGLDQTYQLIVFDEFHGQQTITFMNQFVDGQHMVVPLKGSQYHKNNNPPVIILSNYSPRQCYPKVAESNPDHLDAFVRRFLVIELTEPVFPLLPH